MTDLAQAVDRLFYHTKGSLPQYVPSTPSMYMGLAFGGGILWTGLIPVYTAYQNFKNDTNPAKQIIWIVLLGVVLAASSYVSDVVQEKTYQIHMIRANSQHFANLHWIKQYKKALLN